MAVPQVVEKVVVWVEKKVDVMAFSQVETMVVGQAGCDSTKRKDGDQCYKQENNIQQKHDSTMMTNSLLLLNFPSSDTGMSTWCIQA